MFTFNQQIKAKDLENGVTNERIHCYLWDSFYSTKITCCQAVYSINRMGYISSYVTKKMLPSTWAAFKILNIIKSNKRISLYKSTLFSPHK